MVEWNLNYVSVLPLHKQIENKIIYCIKQGIFIKNKPLPSVRKLSKRGAVSPAMVERAYRQLIKEGVLTYAKGKGYIVADPEKVLVN